MAPRPLAEIVWYLLHSRKYLQPKKIVKPLPLVTMITAAILNFFQPHKSCHTLRWVFLQSFMKFDERNPKSFLNPPFFLSVATAAKFVQPIPIFFGLSRYTRCGCCSCQVSSISAWGVTCYDHFCVFQFFSILAVSMATVAILKILKVVCTSTHSA